MGHGPCWRHRIRYRELDLFFPGGGAGLLLSQQAQTCYSWDGLATPGQPTFRISPVPTLRNMCPSWRLVGSFGNCPTKGNQ